MRKDNRKSEYNQDMNDVKFKAIEACVFDAYGTLLNVHAPVSKLSGRIGEHADALSKLWRQKQLEYTWLRSLMGAHVDFWQVTQDALDYAMGFYAVDDAALRKELCDLYFELDAYEDARICLTELKKAGFKTAILSNGNPAMLDAAVNSSSLGDVLDEVISIEDVGIFKPDMRIYQLAVERMNASSASAICFVSANPWDAQAGAHFGYQVARINRYGLPDDNIPGRPSALLDSLTDLPGVVSS